MHNFYNSVAAVTACVIFGERTNNPDLTMEACAGYLAQVAPAFGRMEKIPIGNKSICILLVKNPIGLDRALAFVSQAADADGLYLLLNSNIADGTDVSWIWDVDFESKSMPDKLFVSGERYAEMLLRLVYSGIHPDRISHKDMRGCAEIFDEALSSCQEGKCLYILPNYTAMLALRKILAKRYRLKDFWR
jgi:UDP-N-acetylmuramyl tripeptide synthase